MGYTVGHKILFAGNYGVPQMRFRTIFIALRDGGRIEFPEPTHNAQAVANFTGAKELCMRIEPLFSQHLEKQATVWDAISGLPELAPGAVVHDIEEMVRLCQELRPLRIPVDGPVYSREYVVEWGALPGTLGVQGRQVFMPQMPCAAGQARQ